MVRRLRAAWGTARPRRGAAAAELALLLPIILALLMGVIEFAMLGHHKLSLAQGARAGVRRAAVGGTIAESQNAVRAAAPYMQINNSQISIEFRDQGNVWLPVQDAPLAGTNAAPYGSLVRVRITGWPHRLVTGSFFSWLPRVTNKSLPLNAEMVMRRE